jgi:glycosyltransferase involved in cell wall biosynthesis
VLPDVSVAIPTHNRSGLLKTTLRSVLRQRDVNIEVIVVDDGSTDDTREVMAALDDARVRVVGHEIPQGVSAARNRGIAEATGEWIAFIDDDDLWAPDKLSRQLEAARKTNRNWAYAGAVKIDAKERIVGGTPPPAPELLMTRLPHWNLMPGGCSNVIASATAVEASGAFDRDLVNLADWDLWIRLSEGGPPACVHAPLVGYRFHTGNSSNDTALILSEAKLIGQRYGTTVDLAALHHYVAWVCMRSGRTLRATRHFAQVALHGESRKAVADLWSIVQGRIARQFSRPHHALPDTHSDWRARGEAWVAGLR